jgi:ankyrin repeat protein
MMPIIKALVENNIDINKKNTTNGNTAFITALHSHKQVEYLVNKQANIFIKNNENKTVIDIAFEKHLNFIKKMPQGSFKENEFFKNYCYLKQLKYKKKLEK